MQILNFVSNLLSYVVLASTLFTVGARVLYHGKVQPPWTNVPLNVAIWLITPVVMAILLFKGIHYHDLVTSLLAGAALAILIAAFLLSVWDERKQRKHDVLMRGLDNLLSQEKN